LVVRQNYPVHEELLRFLRALRAANDLEGVAQADVDGLRLPDQFEERPEQRGADRAAGRIAYVSHRLGLVWIDRGDADGISSNQKFVVHSQAAEGNLGKKKAEIEVIGIRAPHLAEARIVNNVEAESEPIREGDLIEHFE
jgi:hypothetical protein